MGGEGIEKEVVPESFEREPRTLNEGIIVGQILVVPDELALERGHPNDETNKREDDTSNPIFTQVKTNRGRSPDKCIFSSLRLECDHL